MEPERGEIAAFLRRRLEAGDDGSDGMRRAALQQLLDECAEPIEPGGERAFREMVVRLLGLAYVDRDGYRQDWRP